MAIQPLKERFTVKRQGDTVIVFWKMATGGLRGRGERQQFAWTLFKYLGLL